MEEYRYETSIYPEEPKHLKIFKYEEDDLQERISYLIDRGYRLSKLYAENNILEGEEIEERIENTKTELEIISSMLTPQEIFQPLREQLTQKGEKRLH